MVPTRTQSAIISNKSVQNDCDSSADWSSEPLSWGFVASVPSSSLITRTSIHRGTAALNAARRESGWVCQCAIRLAGVDAAGMC